MAPVAPLHLVHPRKLAKLAGLRHEHRAKFGWTMNGDTGTGHIVRKGVVDHKGCHAQTRTLEAQINLLAHIGKQISWTNYGKPRSRAGDTNRSGLNASTTKK